MLINAVIQAKGDAFMQSVTSLAHWTVRLTGITQVTLGLLFWTDQAFQLLPLHMFIGMIFVIAIWVLAGIAARAGLRPLLVVLAVGYGVIIPIFGMNQQRLLPGSAHWVIEVLHLLVGIGGMVLAARLARFIRQHRPNAASASTELARSQAA
jgi:hypothetical protein